MYRLMSLTALVSLMAACAPSGLQPLDANQYAAGENLFPTGSDAELRLAEEIAYGHLYDNADRHLEGIADLWTHRVQIDDLSSAHVRIVQTLDGIPVFGGESIVHLKQDGTVAGLTDNWVRHIELDTTPSYTGVEALDLAVDFTGGWSSVTNTPEPELMILRHDGEDHLVFKVDVDKLDGTEHTAMPRIFVDAKTGQVVWQYDNLQTIQGSATTAYNGSISIPVTQEAGRYELRGDGVGTYTFNNTEPWWTTINASHLEDVTSSSTTFTEDVAADAHFGADRTTAYFASHHNRNGVNGFGGPTLKDASLTSGVHYGSGYNNAFWSGSAMVYGDGDGSTFGPLTALDVAAHEMTHGVTEFSAGLIYQSESGALNESMSDVFAVLVEAWVNGNSIDAWKIGEDCFTPFNGNNDAMRYMFDPSLDGISRDHYSTRYTGFSDNGGVHWNSGITNLAFFLAAQGGNHPTPSKSVTTVQGIGLDAAGAIWYRGLTTYMTSTTNFAGARAALVASAEDLYGAGSAESAAIQDAFAEVGIGSPAPTTDPNPQPDPDPEPDPEPTPDDGSGDATNLSAAQGQQLAFAVQVPAGATELRVTIAGGTGDADLYVRAGAAPTADAWDCRPYASGNVEECVMPNPVAGTWHIGVTAFAAFTGVDLNTTITTAAPAPTGDFLDEGDLSGARESEQFFTLEVPAGATRVTFDITDGSGDADLYVRYGSAPTTATYNCRPFNSGNDETCAFDAPAAGTYHVMVRGYADYAGVDLTASWQ